MNTNLQTPFPPFGGRKDMNTNLQPVLSQAGGRKDKNTKGQTPSRSPEGSKDMNTNLQLAPKGSGGRKGKNTKGQPAPKENLFKVSYSKLATFRRCLQQYKWKYVDGLFPPSSIGQDRGTAGHSALASWHTNYDSTEALQAAWKVWEASGHSGGEDWALLEEALGRYFRWSREVVQDDFVLEMAEQSFQLQYRPKGMPAYQLGGFIDGVVRMPDGTVWFMENKFYKRMENSHSPIDAQVSTYMLAALRLKIPVQGVIYNKIRIGDTKVAEKEPAVRTRVSRSIYGLGLVEAEIEKQTRDMIIFEQKGGETAYRNPTKDCSWDCPFHQACVSWADDGDYPTRLLQQIIHVRSIENE